MRWDQWRKNLKAAARAQKFNIKLEINHHLIDEYDIDLFDEKLKFMCSMFEITLLTDQGKAIARTYDVKYDAQDACKESCEC